MHKHSICETRCQANAIHWLSLGSRIRLKSSAHVVLSFAARCSMMTMFTKCLHQHMTTRTVPHSLGKQHGAGRGIAFYNVSNAPLVSMHTCRSVGPKRKSPLRHTDKHGKRRPEVHLLKERLTANGNHIATLARGVNLRSTAARQAAAHERSAPSHQRAQAPTAASISKYSNAPAPNW